MAVVVVPASAHLPASTFPDGESWHIDELGVAHIRDKEKKHIASFAAREWVSVELETSEASV